ncbi:MAG: hypothetical protein ACHQTF_02765 [Gemmatimonadales bacterium]|jgi:hypothetical protein
MAAVIAIALVGASASACHAPPEAAPRTAPSPTLQQATRPVASVLDAHWLIPGTDTMVISRESDAAPVVYRRFSGRSDDGDAGNRARVDIGMTIQRVRRVTEPDGRDAFEVAFEQRDSSAVLVATTTWVDARTLRPLHQTALLDGSRVVSLVFGHDRLIVTDSAPERPLRMTISPVPDSAYTSAAVDLLLRSLPLAIGYHATVPVYFPADEQVSPLDVRVEGADRITTRSGRTSVCWIVAADFPGNVTERFWIDQRTHSMVRILAHDGPAALVRYDR